MTTPGIFIGKIKFSLSFFFLSLATFLVSGISLCLASLIVSIF